MTPQEIDNRFDYHAPTESKRHGHELARLTIKDTAIILNALLPEGREKALVFTHLDEALMFANAAIARHEP